MSRPTPRKSSLAGSSPVVAAPTPPAPEPSEPQAPAAAPSTTRTPAERKHAPRPSTTGKKYPPKVSFYQDPEDTERLRGALLHTQITEGSRSLSEFIHEAVMAEVERLEAKYNNGKPFPSITAGTLAPGRRVG